MRILTFYIHKGIKSTCASAHCSFSSPVKWLRQKPVDLFFPAIISKTSRTFLSRSPWGSLASFMKAVLSAVASETVSLLYSSAFSSYCSVFITPSYLVINRRCNNWDASFFHLVKYSEIKWNEGYEGKQTPWQFSDINYMEMSCLAAQRWSGSVLHRGCFRRD